METCKYLFLCFFFFSFPNELLTARVRYIVNVSWILPLIRHWDRVPVFVQVYVGPCFLGGVEFVLVVRGNLGRAGIRGDVAAMYRRLLARVVALKWTKLTSRRARRHVLVTNLFARLKRKKDKNWKIQRSSILSRQILFGLFIVDMWYVRYYENRYIVKEVCSTTLLSIEITLNNTTWLLGYLDTEHCIVSLTKA